MTLKNTNLTQLSELGVGALRNHLSTGKGNTHQIIWSHKAMSWNLKLSVPPISFFRQII